MTEKEKIEKVELLLKQYAKYVDDHYSVFISDIRVEHEQLSDLEKLKHPSYKYSFSVDVMTKSLDDKFNKLILRSENEYWVDLDKVLKSGYKYHFMRDIARSIIYHDDPVTNKLVYELYRDSHNNGQAPKATIISNIWF